MPILDHNGDHTPVLRRAVSLSLEFVTASKRQRLFALESAFRSDVNRFVGLFWSDKDARLTAASKVAVSSGRLGSALHGQAHKVAFELVSATRKAAKETGVAPSHPRYDGGLKLASLVSVLLRTDLPNDGSALDVIVDVPSLKSGQRLRLPTKATAPLRKWLARPGARLCNCVEIHGDRMTVVVEFPRPALKIEGEVLGVDLGMNKLIATSRGEMLGTDFREVTDKIRRRRPGSNGKKRALRERDQLVDRVLNQLPWNKDEALGWPGTRAVASEDLTGIKRGKHKGQTKEFRRKRSSWAAGRVNTRLSMKAEEHGSYFISVNASWNSQTCHACGDLSPDKKTRQGAIFRCVKCGLVDDADHNAAVNASKRGATALLGIESKITLKTLEWEAGAEERKKKREQRLAARVAKTKANRAARHAAQARKADATASGSNKPEIERSANRDRVAVLTDDLRERDHQTTPEKAGGSAKGSPPVRTSMTRNATVPLAPQESGLPGARSSREAGR